MALSGLGASSCNRGTAKTQWDTDEHGWTLFMTASLLSFA